MVIYPKITLTLFNGFLLILPLLIFRFGIPALIRKSASAKLNYFAPAVGDEKTALTIYYYTNTFLVFSPLFAKIRTDGSVVWLGLIFYVLGLLVLVPALITFSNTEGGLVTTGIYRWSRNPIYLAYFLILIGIAFLINSWAHVLITLIYQISVHGLILSEERWCREQFPEQFLTYSKHVRRYF